MFRREKNKRRKEIKKENVVFIYQKSYVLFHMWTLDLGQSSNVVGLGSHAKGRAHTRGMGIGRKPKT
jgi:hypothetical protein